MNSPLTLSFAIGDVYYEADKTTLAELRDARLDEERGAPGKLARGAA